MKVTFTLDQAATYTHPPLQFRKGDANRRDLFLDRGHCFWQSIHSLEVCCISVLPREGWLGKHRGKQQRQQSAAIHKPIWHLPNGFAFWILLWRGSSGGGMWSGS